MLLPLAVCMTVTSTAEHNRTQGAFCAEQATNVFGHTGFPAITCKHILSGVITAASEQRIGFAQTPGT